MPTMLRAPDAGGGAPGGLPATLSSRFGTVDLGGAGPGGSPDCWFRRRSLEGLKGIARPTLTQLIADVAVPAVHGRLAPVFEAPVDDPALLASRATHLATLLRHADATAARQLVESTLAEGVSREALLLHCLRGAEERLAGQHARDRLSSLALTLAICHLRTLATLITRDAPADDSAGRRAAVLAMPGDPLTFGAMLHECLLRLRGWEIDKLEGLSLHEAGERLTQDPPEVVLCVLNDAALQRASGRWIARLRRLCNRPFYLGVGAGFAAADEAAAERCGLDAVSADPHWTLRLAAVRRRGRYLAN